MDKPFTVYVWWGEDGRSEQRQSRYDFATEAERDAFVLGVDESNGWMDYTARTPEDGCGTTNKDGEECTLKAGHDGDCAFPQEEV